jgi:DNA mismatch repair protein MutS
MGSSLYGLEFAKSLHMDKTFLKNAHDIRENLLGKSSELKQLTTKKRSRYNKNLYVTKCALCEECVEDVHHIEEQNLANDAGMIGAMNKNHRYNLIPLCKKHHTMVHKGKINISGFVMTSKGIKLHYEEK